MMTLARIFSVLVMFSVTSATADEWQSDAFGLYPVGSDPQRDRWAGLSIGLDDETTRLVSAGDVHDIYFFAGPKSQPAGKDRVHLVALGFDADGNMIADGTDVAITKGNGAPATRTIRAGIADLLHNPSDIADSYVAGAQIAGVQSARAIYRVVPDINSMSPGLPPMRTITAESFGDVQTRQLTDTFGNTVNDGIGMSVWIHDELQRWSRADAVTVGGVARSRVLSRAITGATELSVDLASSQSAVQTLNVKPLRPAGRLLSRMEIMPEIDAVRLRVGAFTTDAGHVLNDGVGVRITIETASGRHSNHDTWVRDGMVELLLAESANDLPHRIEVSSTLGVQISNPQIVDDLNRAKGMRE